MPPEPWISYLYFLFVLCPSNRESNTTRAFVIVLRSRIEKDFPVTTNILQTRINVKYVKILTYTWSQTTFIKALPTNTAVAATVIAQASSNYAPSIQAAIAVIITERLDAWIDSSALASRNPSPNTRPHSGGS